MSWIKKITGEGDGDGPKKEQLKRIKMMAAGLIVGVGLIFWGSLGGDKPANDVTPPPVRENAAPTQTQNQKASQKTAMAVEEEHIANKLCEMLKQVEGAGNVRVTVCLESSTETQYAVNSSTGKKTTLEKDQAGGTRTLTEDTDTGQLVLVNRSGEQIPVMSKEIAPSVAGVLVVAEGATNPRVKAELFRATQVALGIDPHKVIVMPRKAGE